MKMVGLFFMVSLILAKSAGALDECYTNEGACGELKTMVQKTLDETPETPIGEQVANFVGDAKIAFLGEVFHDDLDAIKGEADIIRALQKRGFDCLFIEYPNGRKTFSENLNNAEKDVQALMKLTTAKAGWIPAARTAKELGMKVFEFDDNNQGDEFGESLYHIRRRNQTMWGILSEKLQRGKCNKAITLNGYYHLVIDGEKKRSLEGLAAQAGIPSKTVLLRSRSLEQGNPLLRLPCDYDKLGGTRPYLLREKSDIKEFQRWDLDDLGKKNEETIPPVRLDGNRGIVIY